MRNAESKRREVNNKSVVMADELKMSAPRIANHHARVPAVRMTGALATAAGAIAALAASSYCILRLAFLGLGISGA